MGGTENVGLAMADEAVSRPSGRSATNTPGMTSIPVADREIDVFIAIAGPCTLRHSSGLPPAPAVNAELVVLVRCKGCASKACSRGTSDTP